MSLTDEQLRTSLAAVLTHVDVDTDLATVHARTDRRRVRRRAVAVACVVFAVGLAGTGIALLTSSATDHGPRSVVAEPAPTPSSTPSTTPATTLLPAGVARIDPSAITAFPPPDGAGATLALGAGSAWIGGWPADLQGCHVGCGHVTRVDAGTGTVVTTIGVSKLPRALAYGFGALWAEVEVPDDSPALVVKIDPATNQVVAETELTGTSIVGSTGHPRLAVGAGAVWSLYGNRLDKIDPVSGAIVTTTTLPAAGDRLVANDEGVWMIDADHMGVSSIEPTSLEVTQIVSLPSGYVQSATIDGDTIWLTEAHGSGPVIELVRIDTHSGEATFTGISTTNVSAGSGRVWFQGFSAAMAADTHPDDVVELDPTTARPIRAATVDYGALTQAVMAVDRDSVWLLSGGGLVRIRA